jgi:hypothetical protein
MRLTRFRIVGLTFFALTAGLGTAILLLRHEPDFYSRVDLPPGPEREEKSNHFLTEGLARVINGFQGGDRPWNVRFTQDDINSYLAEHFVRLGDADGLSDLGIRNPRIEFEGDRIRIGFRYGTGFWSTVLTYDLKVWLVSSEINVLAVEIERRRAGALPIPTRQIFQEMKDLGRRNNFDVEWYRHDGNPVAIIKLQSDRPRPTAHLRHLEITAGTLQLQGAPFDPGRPIDETIKTPVTQGS